MVSVIAYGHAQAANAAEEDTLQQGGAFAWRSFPLIAVITVGVVEQLRLVGAHELGHLDLFAVHM